VARPLAALELGGDLRADAALARQLAFAVGDDHFQPLVVRAIASRRVVEHGADIVGADGAQPLEPIAFRSRESDVVSPSRRLPAVLGMNCAPVAEV